MDDQTRLIAEIRKQMDVGVLAARDALDKAGNDIAAALELLKHPTEATAPKKEVFEVDKAYLTRLATETQFRFVDGRLNMEKIRKQFLKDYGEDLYSSKFHRMIPSTGLQIRFKNHIIEFIESIAKQSDPKTLGNAAQRGQVAEESVLHLLTALGFQVQKTPASADQGVDLLAERDGVRIAVQVKDWQKPVGNAAVMEVHSGQSYYDCTKAAVFSFSGFTDSAAELAARTGTTLVDFRQISHFVNSLLDARPRR